MRLEIKRNTVDRACADPGRWDDYTDRFAPTLRVSCTWVMRVRPENGMKRTKVEDRPAKLRISGPPKAEEDGGGKPAYLVPSMEEIRALKPNGFRVASTFSGCGGTCLGWRMAGFSVLYASEFVPAARESYLANCCAETFLDPRDVRLVEPAEILERFPNGEVDVLEGSPPCASFSTAGKRHRDWGKVKAYSDVKQRTDDLFFEFARLVDGVRPKVFIAENVSGLVKGSAKGYFLEILARLKACGYRVEAKLLDAQWLGVPQARQRIFFQGVREDLDRSPAWPKPWPFRYSLRDACPWIVRQSDNGDFGGGSLRSSNAPSPTIGASPQTRNGRFLAALVQTAKGKRSVDEPVPTVLQHGRRGTHSEMTIVEAEADISRFAIGAEARKLREGQQSDRYHNLVRAHRERPCPTVTAPAGMTSAATVIHPTETRRFTIAELKRVCSFPDDFVLTGTYAQQWERLGRSVPPLMARAIAEAVRDRVLAP